MTVKDDARYELRLLFETTQERTDFCNQTNFSPLRHNDGSIIDTSAESIDVVKVPVEMDYSDKNDSEVGNQL